MAIYEPRPYQAQCVTALVEARKSGTRKGLVVMASGLGKTLTTIFDLQQFLQEQPNAHVLYLCHQESILAQSKRKFQKVFGEECSYGMYTGNYKTRRAVTFLFATFQTMRDHREEFAVSAFDYIVVDEAHHTAADTYQPTADYFEPQFLLGLTATKDRMDGQDILDTYEQILFQKDIYDGWAEGWLARVDYRIMLDDLNQEEFEKYVGPQTSNEKVSIAQLNKTIFAPKRDEEIVTSIREQTADLENPSIFVFCSNIDHANAMVHHFGGEAAVIHSGQSPSLNEAILSEFRSGNIRIIVSVNMLNEGIDIPEADVVVFLRATDSSTIFFQQLGRGLRIGAEKRTVRVLDYVANLERISTILEMEETAKKRLLPASTSLASPRPDPLIVDIPVTKFRIQKADVEQVLARLKCTRGWTDEEMLECLKRKAEELGHTPTCREVDADETMPSSITYLHRFGSFSAATEAAGLIPRLQNGKERRGSDFDARLIAALKAKATALGRSPSKLECDADATMSSAWMYIQRFGSWNNALQAAGLDVYGHVKPGTWTRDCIVAALQLKAQELGRTPTMLDCGQDRNMPAADTVKRVFGSWSNALIQAGLKSPKTIEGRGLTESKLIELLLAKASRMGRTPTLKSVNQDPDMPNGRVYQRRFGSWNAAIKAAGLAENN